MSTLTTRNSTQVIIKSRGRIGGKRATYDEIENEIVKLAISGMSMVKIVEVTGKDRTTVWRYINKAKKKGLIKRGDNNRVELTKEKQAEIQHEVLQKDSFMKKYPCVENWVSQRHSETRGDPKKVIRVKAQLATLKVICDTLELNPYSILAEKDGVLYGGLKSAMTEFYNHVVADTIKNLQNRKSRQLEDDEEPDYDSVFRNYLMAARNFALYSGIALPKFPKDHILSGKKTAFGNYAHVKLSWSQIEDCVVRLMKIFGEDSKEVAMFCFYYITGTRAKSIYKIETSTISKNMEGWLTCRAYESKTKTTWTKFIPSDNPHFEILEKYFQKRIKSGQKYIFLDKGESIKHENIKSYNDALRNIFEQMQITEKYFFKRPTHSLRHVAAHYWLARTNLNHTAVAKILGWDDVQTLIKCYGEVTEQQIIQIVKDVEYHHGS